MWHKPQILSSGGRSVKQFSSIRSLPQSAVDSQPHLFLLSGQETARCRFCVGVSNCPARDSKHKLQIRIEREIGRGKFNASFVYVQLNFLCSVCLVGLYAMLLIGMSRSFGKEFYAIFIASLAPI